MKMRDGSHDGEFAFHEKEHAEWEAVENGSPKVSRNPWESQRPFFDARQGCSKCIEEFHPKPFAFTFVPHGRLEGVEFSFWPDVQPSHLPTGAETLLKSFDDLFPWTGFLRGPPMRRKPFVQNGLLPPLKGHLVQARRDVIPKRLHVVDLFFHGKSVESGGRQGQRMRHAPDYTTGTLCLPD